MIPTGATTTQKPVEPVRLQSRGAKAWENAYADRRYVPRDVWVNRLNVHAVDDATNVAYVRAVKIFLTDLKRQHVEVHSVADIDRAMAEFMNHYCYVEQSGVSKGALLISGFNHVFESTRGKLPLSARALAAWGQLAAVGEGTSACREAIAAVFLDMLDHDAFLPALLVLLSFDVFAREQDWIGLYPDDIAFDGMATSVLFGRRERGQRSKTGFYQGAIIALPVVAKALQLLAKNTSSSAQLFPTSAATFRAAWWDSLRRLGLEAVGPPHRLRHTGAGEFVSRGGSLEACRRRGRWAALSSVQRYTKVHFVVRSRAAMASELRRRGEAFWRDPAGSISKKLAGKRGLDAWGITLREAAKATLKQEVSAKEFPHADSRPPTQGVRLSPESQGAAEGGIEVSKPF